MGVGIFLIVLGAILTFAIKDDVPKIHLGIVGFILMLAGGVVIWHSRQGWVREREITKIDSHEQSPSAPRTVREIIRDREID